MDLKVLEDAGQIAQAVSQIIIEGVSKKSNSVLGFATGASPVPTYELLVRAYKRGELSLKDVTTFNLDEYCGIPADAPQSYRSFMFENLFGLTDVDPEKVNFLNGNAPDYEAECLDYEGKIVRAGGIDIQLLGVGTNGHIGFNEPSDFFTDIPFAVTLTESTKRSNSKYFPDGRVPDYALTMGVGDIMRARKIILIATGESKKNAVKTMAEGIITPQCPASALRLHPDALVFADRDAASLL